MKIEHQLEEGAGSSHLVFLHKKPDVKPGVNISRRCQKPDPAAAHCIILFMNIPDTIVTEMELKRSNGERGTRKYIAYQGIVYDVTDCPKWRMDLHEQLHFPGQDLTGELPDAPHEEDVFSRPCVKVVGKLQRIQR